MQHIWTDILPPANLLFLLEKAIRTVVVYGFLLVSLRLAGKRELVQLNPFDLVVLLLLSNTLQNAIIGEDNSVLGGIFGAALLLAINAFAVRFLYKHPKLEEMVEGKTEVLIEDGSLNPDVLQKNAITTAELEAAARRQGIAHLDEVAHCCLEVGGALTFIQRQPTDEEKRHQELIDRLARLEAHLGALVPAAQA